MTWPRRVYYVTSTKEVPFCPSSSKYWCHWIPLCWSLLYCYIWQITNEVTHGMGVGYNSQVTNPACRIFVDFSAHIKGGKCNYTRARSVWENLGKPDLNYNVEMWIIYFLILSGYLLNTFGKPSCTDFIQKINWAKIDAGRRGSKIH